MGLKLVSPPATDAVSLTQAKSHLREDSTDFDTQIGVFIKAATRKCENFMGRALVDQTWQLTLDAFPGANCVGWGGSFDGSAIKIPKPPLIAIVSIKYDDTTGAEQTLDPSLYSVDNQSEPGWVLPVGSWPSTFSGINSVRIQFRAGYLSDDSPPVSNVPEEIQVAILMLIASFNLNRENEVIGDTVANLPFGVENLLRDFNVETSMA